MARLASLFIIVVTLMASPIALRRIVGAERVNKSASVGLIWSTAKDEGDLVSKAEADESASVFTDQDNDFDGGFSSLDGMLQWAIGHSDPERLKETAADVQRLSPEELKRRQMEIKELMEKLKMPSDSQLMKVAIDDLNNSSLPLEERHRALHELLILVEPVDNANDLNKLGGLTVIIRELAHPDPEIRAVSAWVLGKACQNNPIVQKQALYATKSLLQLKSTDVLAFKDFCELDVALEKLRQQLQQLMAEENHKEYAMDIESLLKEVEFIYLHKLNKSAQVHT